MLVLAVTLEPVLCRLLRHKVLRWWVQEPVLLTQDHPIYSILSIVSKCESQALRQDELDDSAQARHFPAAPT